VIAELYTPDGLLKLVTALRALKSDHKRVGPRHFALRVMGGVDCVNATTRSAEMKKPSKAAGPSISTKTSSLLLLFSGLGSRLVTLILLGRGGGSARRGGLRGFTGADLGTV
jgi:hypothetical protein